jgi:hypothetical protein
MRDIETYSPMPLDEHPSGSPLPLAMFVAGVVGFAGFFALMTYANLVAYPQNIGGRPQFAWPAFVPIAFELGVLCAVGAGFVGYFFVAGMTRLYEPVDECRDMRRASRDEWFVAVGSLDDEGVSRARTLLAPCQPASLEEFEP